MLIDKQQYIQDLKCTYNGYAPITEKSWLLIEELIHFQTLRKEELLLAEGQLAKNIHYVCKGALRAFITDKDGNIYNKNIFLEGNFCASKVSLLQQKPSKFTLESLEDSILINMNYIKFRELIDNNDDLKNFYIAYLERNWVIEKEQREISLVMEEAKERYLKLLRDHPVIEKRIQKLHIAAHLGITPTQLSRIRTALKKTN